MERHVHPSLRASLALLLYVLLAACGGGGEGDTTSTEVTVEGSWSGSYAPPGATRSSPAYALIQNGGPALLYDGSGIVYRLPSLDGAYSFQGHVAAYAPIGYQFTAGGRDFDIQGTALDSKITGDLQSDEGSGSLDLSPFDTSQGNAAIVPGQWLGYYITPTPYFLGLTIDAAGAVSGDDVFGCHLSGRMHRLQPGENLFKISVVTTGPAPVCGATFKGLAHQTDYDTFGYFRGAPGTYYYLVLVAPGRAFAAELKVQ